MKKDPKKMAKEIKELLAKSAGMKTAIIDAGDDEEAVGIAKKAFETHTAEITAKNKSLKSIIDTANADLAQKQLLEDAEELTSIDGKIEKKSLKGGKDKVSAEAIDYVEKENVHSKTFTNYMQKGMTNEISGEAAKLIAPNPEIFSKGSTDGAKMPRSLVIKMLGEHRAKRLGMSDFDIALSRKANTLVSNIPAYGGDLVPEDFRATILNLEEEGTHIIDRATVLPSATGEITIPKAVQSDENEYGGMSAVWINETDDKTQTDTTFTQEVIPTHELALSIEISERMLARSAINIEAFVIQKGRATLMNTLDKAFVSGNGDGKPLGFLETAGIRIVDRDTAGQVSMKDTNRLKYALLPQHRRTGVYVMADEVLQYLDDTTDNENRPLFKPSYANGPYDRLNNFPYDSMTYMPEMGYQGDIAFCDLSNYYVAMEQDIVVRRLNEIEARKNVVVYTMYAVVGGQLVQERTCSVLAGTVES